MSGMKYSVVTPSRGTRPKALALAIESVALAIEAAAGLIDPGQVEMLVGFDGVRGERVSAAPFVRWFDLPADNNYGNGIRDTLLRAASGERVLLVDDDNGLTPEAFQAYESQAGADMVIGRIDCSRAFAIPFLPVLQDGASLIRPGNIDPLCLCLSRELVVVRCGGWRGEGRYESDYLNIIRYHRRARRVAVVETVVGVYDAGSGLDESGRNIRQMRTSGVRESLSES